MHKPNHNADDHDSDAVRRQSKTAWSGRFASHPFRTTRAGGISFRGLGEVCAPSVRFHHLFLSRVVVPTMKGSLEIQLRKIRYDKLVVDRVAQGDPMNELALCCRCCAASRFDGEPRMVLSAVSPGLGVRR